ncbi:MAG TPA: alanine--glyoxylate aminotransferase family protein [Terriglobales bacterium]|nr:alanine--glyoxylate aminotransferase family protein [Terriglobales bacterium]
MLRKTRLFTPGPTPLLPAAQVAMASAGMHHRTAEFRSLFTRTLADLKEFIGTRNDVVLLASSGTGAMEASVSNLTSPGDQVLVLSAGKFGERWRDLTQAYSCQVELVSAAYGQTLSSAQIREKLTPGVRAVYVQATESSTGVRHDVEAIAGLVRARAPEALLVVDAITGLGTTRLEVDGWGIDVIIGGSQKALMIPPGLAYLAVSERAWQRAESTRSPRYYFDLRRERKAAAKGESAYTPATALIAALGAALEYLRQGGDGSLAVGRDRLIAGAELCAQMTRSAVAALGLRLFAPTAPASALTAVVPPAGLDSGKIVAGLRENFGAVVANGQGEMKGKLFRVAHIGYYDYLDTIGVVGALEHVLAAAGAPVELGAGLRAAQEVYAAAADATEPAAARA